MPKKILCPHCQKPIRPASILGKMSAEKRDTTSEKMRELARKRWDKRPKK